MPLPRLSCTESPLPEVFTPPKGLSGRAMSRILINF